MKRRIIWFLLLIILVTGCTVPVYEETAIDTNPDIKAADIFRNAVPTTQKVETKSRNSRKMRNIAVGKTAESFTYYDENFKAGNVIDDNLETIWGSQADTDIDYIIIDLGKIMTFDELRLIWYRVEEFSFHAQNIVFFTSPDYENWTQIHEEAYCNGEDTIVSGIFNGRYVGILLQNPAQIVFAMREFRVLQEMVPVNFPDPELDDIIRDQLNMPFGQLYSNDLLSITEIDTFTISGTAVLDLTGLEYCKNLTILNLNSNASTPVSIDLTPLKGLPLLRELTVRDYNIKDKNAIRELTALKELTLIYSDLDDLTVMSTLTKLNMLTLSSTKVTDLRPLKTLTGLNELMLNKNNITSLDGLGDLNNLKNLEIRNLPITNIGPLQGLTNLTSLTLSGNNITNLQPLSGLTSLTYLQVCESGITDITPLGKLLNLNELLIWRATLNDLSPLQNLTNMKFLFLCECSLSDTSVIGRLSFLERLTFAANNITDISVIGNLTGLQKLDVSFNKIKDLRPLQSLSNLTTVTVTFNDMEINSSTTQGAINLNIVNSLIANNCDVDWRIGNITD